MTIQLNVMKQNNELLKLLVFVGNLSLESAG